MEVEVVAYMFLLKYCDIVMSLALPVFGFQVAHVAYGNRERVPNAAGGRSRFLSKF